VASTVGRGSFPIVASLLVPSELFITLAGKKHSHVVNFFLNIIFIFLKNPLWCVRVLFVLIVLNVLSAIDVFNYKSLSLVEKCTDSHLQSLSFGKK